MIIRAANAPLSSYRLGTQLSIITFIPFSYHCYSKRFSSKFGKLNTVVNCAGIGAAEKTLGRKGPHSLDNFMRVLQVNTAGTFNMIRLSSERMSENDPRFEDPPPPPPPLPSPLPII